MIPALGRSPGEGNGNPFSILAWRIPQTEDPGGLQSMGSQRVGRDLVTNTYLLIYLSFTFSFIIYPLSTYLHLYLLIYFKLSLPVSPKPLKTCSQDAVYQITSHNSHILSCFLLLSAWYRDNKDTPISPPLFTSFLSSGWRGISHHPLHP